jgi:hypothetical protein
VVAYDTHQRHYQRYKASDWSAMNGTGLSVRCVGQFANAVGEATMAQQFWWGAQAAQGSKHGMF